MKRSVEKLEYLKRLLVGTSIEIRRNDEQKLSRRLRPLRYYLLMLCLRLLMGQSRSLSY